MQIPALAIVFVVGATCCQWPAQAEQLPPCPSVAAERPSLASASHFWRRVSSSDGALDFAYRFFPGEPPLHEPFSALIILSGSATQEPLVFGIDAAMVSHGHGMPTRPEVIGCRSNVYWVDGLYFQMAGEWSVYFDITIGGITERTEARIVVCTPFDRTGSGCAKH
jgi:hypothetical protein